jgi:hypothetical protein
MTFGLKGAVLRKNPQFHWGILRNGVLFDTGEPPRDLRAIAANRRWFSGICAHTKRRDVRGTSVALMRCERLLANEEAKERR